MEGDQMAALGRYCSNDTSSGREIQALFVIFQAVRVVCRGLAFPASDQIRANMSRGDGFLNGREERGRERNSFDIPIVSLHPHMKMSGLRMI